MPPTTAQPRYSPNIEVQKKFEKKSRRSYHQKEEQRG
jgi:hypothetical protein